MILVSSPPPDFEFGTDGPSLMMVGVDVLHSTCSYAGGRSQP